MRTLVLAIWIMVLGLISVSARAQSHELQQKDPNQQSIVVHGFWVIEIFNPDGTLDSVHEFENALESQGGEYLARILTGEEIIGGWAIHLRNSDPSLCLCDTGGSRYICVLGETGVTYSGPPHSSNLIVSRSEDQIVLSARVIATYTGVIDIVTTYIKVCSNIYTPTECRSQTMFSEVPFTSHTESSVIPVQANQQVQVTVTLSFS